MKKYYIAVVIGLTVMIGGISYKKGWTAGAEQMARYILIENALCPPAE